MREGVICEIERCSLSDGPGIRTVVFLKGCNLACAWCHNPETIAPAPQLLHYADKCTRCGRCAAVCPADAIDDAFRTRTARCRACGRCAQACPARARRLSGQRMSTADVLREVLADRAFYAASGGGVTFSGGECMLQTDFLCDLLAACCQERLSVAVDTAGNVPFAWFARILPETDWLLYDIKCVTPALHRALTGADNARILENYRRLWRAAPHKLVVRIPVVPGCNTVDGELAHVAALLRAYPPARYELLPYHALGEAKRAALGMRACGAQTPDAQAMASYQALFAGVPTST